MSALIELFMLDNYCDRGGDLIHDLIANYPNTPNKSFSRKRTQLQDVKRRDLDQPILIFRIDSNMPEVAGKRRLPLSNRHTKFNRQNTHTVGTDDQHELGLFSFPGPGSDPNSTSQISPRRGLFICPAHQIRSFPFSPLG
jgi:hypothetical protein